MLFALNSSNKICLVSVCIGDNPIPKLYLGNKQSYSNFQLENNVFRTYDKNKYENGSLMMSEASNSTNVANKYIYANSSSLGTGSSWTTGISCASNTNGQKRLINDSDSYLFVNNIIDSSNKFTSISDRQPTYLSNSVDSSYYSNLESSSKGARYRYTRYDNGTTLPEMSSPVLIKTKIGNTLGNIILFSLVKDDFTNISYTSNVVGRITPVYNLIPSTLYYYRVLDSNNNIISLGSFKTEGKIRLLKFSGVRNARDCGGWESFDFTKRFKYGILFRGSELESGDMVLGMLPEDLQEFINNLKITQEIELRGSGSYANKTHLVTPKYVNGTSSASSYGSLVTNINLVGLLARYVTAEAANGGATYIHCLLGRDRTGSIVAILQALCGICDDGITKDYELSTFFAQETTRYGLCNVIWDTEERDSSTRRTTKAKFKNTGTFSWMKNTSGSTVLELTYNWYKYLYNNLTANTYRIYYKNSDNETIYITDADNAIEYMRGVLLESNVKSEKTVAVIGDSLSKFKISRQGYSPFNMWWYKVSEAFEMNPSTHLTNSSFGDSKVTLSDDKSIRACSLERINSLKVNGKDPDVIFIMIGGNDWNSSALLGSWSSESSYPDDSSGDLLDFKPAYALMLHRLKITYPHAKIICLNYPDFGIPTSPSGNSFSSYMNAIVEVAEQFNCSTINLYQLCQLEIANNTSSYINDSYVHLNSAGHLYIANKIINEINSRLLL